MSITVLKPSRRRGVRLDKVSDRSLGFVPAHKVKTPVAVSLAIAPKIRRADQLIPMGPLTLAALEERNGNAGK